MVGHEACVPYRSVLRVGHSRSVADKIGSGEKPRVSALKGTQLNQARIRLKGKGRLQQCLRCVGIWMVKMKPADFIDVVSGALLVVLCHLALYPDTCSSTRQWGDVACGQYR